MTIPILNKTNPTVSDVFKEVHIAVRSNNPQTVKQLLKITRTLATKTDKVAKVKLLGIALALQQRSTRADSLDPFKIIDLTHQLCSKKPEELVHAIKIGLQQAQIQRLRSPIIIPASSDLDPPPPPPRDDLAPPPPPRDDVKVVPRRPSYKTPAPSPSSRPRKTSKAALYEKALQDQANNSKQRLFLLKQGRATKTASDTSDVDVKAQRELIRKALFGEMKKIIEANDIFTIVNRALDDENQVALSEKLNETVKRIVPKVDQKIADLEEICRGAKVNRAAFEYLLESQSTTLSPETMKKLQKYCLYLETLDIDLAKFSKQNTVQIPLNDPDHNNWFQYGQWPSHAASFVRWHNRLRLDPPKKYNSKAAVKECIEQQSKDLIVQTSLQLSMNYWQDAYDLCLELQGGQLPEKVKRMGRRMEELLWLKERDALQAANYKGTYNSRRLPQPTDL